MTTATTTPDPRPSAVDDLGRDPLAPVRAALVAHARRDADADVEQANREAAQTLARAQAEADDIRGRARAEGEKDAEQLRVEQRARARRRARSIVLRTQSGVVEQLRTRVRAAARQLWDDPATHAAVRERLVAVARREIGAQARISDHPDGGIVAVTDHARATYLVADLADAAVDHLADDLAGLWTP